MADPMTEHPGAGAAQGDGLLTPAPIVERFLSLLCTKDIDAAADLLASNVEYINVGLPTIHGRERVRRVLQASLGPAGAGFEVYMHAISAHESSVLTERTDVLSYRRLRIQIWVCGRFDVQGGEIVLWRDYFSATNFMAATLRGLLGVFIPAVRAKPPVI
jgi:limonene-1,2-epoxide hydrolase